jgi:hypothetical protein
MGLIEHPHGRGLELGVNGTNQAHQACCCDHEELDSWNAKVFPLQDKLDTVRGQEGIAVIDRKRQRGANDNNHMLRSPF